MLLCRCNFNSPPNNIDRAGIRIYTGRVNVTEIQIEPFTTSPGCAILVKHQVQTSTLYQGVAWSWPSPMVGWQSWPPNKLIIVFTFLSFHRHTSELWRIYLESLHTGHMIADCFKSRKLLYSSTFFLSHFFFPAGIAWKLKWQSYNWNLQMFFNTSYSTILLSLVTEQILIMLKDYKVKQLIATCIYY